jgi:hypothetical protein
MINLTWSKCSKGEQNNADKAQAVEEHDSVCWILDEVGRVFLFSVTEKERDYFWTIEWGYCQMANVWTLGFLKYNRLST